jgi:hypothetical protein
MRKARVVPLRLCVGLFLFLLALAPALLEAQQAAPPPNKGFSTIRETLSANCAACHSWAGSHKGIADPKRVTPRDPDRSPLWTFLADGTMPPSSPKLSAVQLALVRAWIAAGAPSGDEPLAAGPTDATAAATEPAPAAQPAADASSAATEPAPAGQPADSTTAATGSPAAGGTARLSPYAKKVLFHEISGFTSGGLLLASGLLGGIHLLNMMDAAHEYQEVYDQDSPQCRAAMLNAWRGDQTLRWVHVSLFSSGELLYLADAITGIGMLTPDRPGLTKQDIHRYAFFTHAALMVAELALGFLTTDALQKGGHDTMLALAAAHTAIGIAIPVIILGAGAYAALR